MTDFVTLDVFTDVAYGGNPLAVVTDAQGIPSSAMQRIAREFNCSETTFVLPPDDPAHAARVRIFTPTMEVPFAGHPIVGTAVALADRGPDMVFELGIGPVSVRVDGDMARFRTKADLVEVSRPAADDVAACLGLDPSAITVPPVQAGVGLPFVLAQLTDRDALSACQPNTDAFRMCAGRYPSDLDFAVYAYVLDGVEVHARMFAPLDNIPEDPATGSAAAALSTYLGTGPRRIRQGVDMGRPSLIETDVQDGFVAVGGRAQHILSGRIETLPAGDRTQTTG